MKASRDNRGHLTKRVTKPAESVDASKKWLSRIWRHAEVCDTIGGVAGTALLIYGAAKWVQQWLDGTAGRINVIPLGLCALLWLGCWVHLFFRKNSSPKWLSRLSSIGIIAVPFLVAASLLGWHYYQSWPSDKIIVLVADFEGPDPTHHSITSILIENLRQATKKYHDVQIKRVLKNR